jgi:signal transduction histidine kinase
VSRAVVDASHPLELRLPEELRPVLADERRLQQVMTNLVANAITHSPPDSPVVVEARPDHVGVTFAVIDRGKGIDPAFLPQIFEPFAQQERGGRGTGLGLGLYIVRGLVEAMGGSIEAHSRLGQGTELCVWLPYAA